MWYPTEPAYNGAMGAPIVVDSNWSVLIAGSNTSHSAPINMSGPQGGANAGNTPFPPNAFQRDHNVSAPSLFAVHGWGKAGRVALLNQWRQFTVGSGSRWLYNDVVLSRGLRGRRSMITSPRGVRVMISLVLQHRVGSSHFSRVPRLRGNCWADPPRGLLGGLTDFCQQGSPPCQN